MARWQSLAGATTMPAHNNTFPYRQTESAVELSAANREDTAKSNAPMKRLRVYFEDGSSTTLECSERCTAQSICGILVQKRRLDHVRPSFLALRYGFDGYELERKLTRHECPLVVIEALRRLGRLGSAKLVFRNPPLAVEFPSTSIRQDNSGRHLHQRAKEFCGFLDHLCRKRGWKRRWVVLSEGKLFWFKSIHDRKVRGFVNLSDSYVQRSRVAPLSTAATTKFGFELVRTNSIIRFRASDTGALHQWMFSISHHCATDFSEDALLDAVQLQIEDAECEAWNCNDSLLERLSTLDSVLLHQNAFELFLHYLSERHCEEPLLFWHAVHQFKCSPLSEEQCVRVARAIFDEFLQPGAARELTIHVSERIRVLRLLRSKPLDRSLFDTIQHESLTQLGTKQFPEFRKSSEFQRILPCSKPLQVDEEQGYSFDEAFVEVGATKPLLRSPSFENWSPVWLPSKARTVHRLR